MDYREDPRYQRVVQRYMRLRPDQRAIIDTAAIDESFADKEMQKMLQLHKQGSAEKERERNYELSTRDSDMRNEYRMAGLGLDKEKVALSKTEADRKYELAQAGLGLDDERMRIARKDLGLKDMKQDSYHKDAALGDRLAGLSLIPSAFTGFGNLKNKIAQERNMDELISMYRNAGRDY